MSVRVVRLRNGEDVIADLYEVTQKDEPEKPIAFQLRFPYSIYVVDPTPNVEVDGTGQIQKLSSPEISFQPWAPFSKDNTLMLKLEEVVSAYETFEEVITKYNELVEAAKGGGGNDATAVESNTAETTTGVPVGEGDGA
tara:strand:- start:42 stop:458 length:417 start_codon:yes stop_codon:yes gene_type:complete